MKILFDEINKRLTIKNCNFEAVEIQKNGKTIADIPLTKGEGFITNTDGIVLDDDIVLYPYRILKAKVKKELDVKIEAIG